MVFTKAQAKSLAILDVARSLGMEMKRSSHKEYYWTEHDSFKINTTKNTWHWYSRGTFGDTINLVQEMRGVSYKEAMAFLETGHFPEAKPMEEVLQPFRYTLSPYEQPFREARTFLKETRGLSDETIDFFLEKGVLAQARRKDRDGFIEDVLVFKYLDRNQNIVGASLQGLVPYPKRHEGKGYLKQIMYQSEGVAGLNVSIGSPERLVVAEAPIDLMSYYELHKSELDNVRLVAMEGLKEGVLSRYAMEALQERGVLKEIPLDYTKSKDLAQVSNFLSETARLTTLFHDDEHQNLITLAVDQDKAGTDFLENLREKNIPVIDARPPKGEGQEKMDWNDYLKQERNAIIPPLANTMTTYDDVKQENAELVNRLEERIKAGDLSISFETDVYLYDVFAKLGNSHPFKYLNDKRLEVLAPLRPMLAAIDDKTVDLYKNKGTTEQDTLYHSLAPHQRTLGVDVSTRFIGELAIAAYSTNKHLDSLSTEHFGSHYGNRALDNLSQSIEQMLEYPLNELRIKDYTYGFVTTPNAFYHYLEEQEGEVILNRSTLDTLISRIEERPVHVVESIQEEVTATPKEKASGQILKQEMDRSDGSMGSLQPKAEGSPAPVTENSATFEQTVTSHPTFSYPLLKFSTKGEKVQRRYKDYHLADAEDMKRLKQYAPSIQSTAQWYLNEVTDSRIMYVFAEDGSEKVLAVDFLKENFIHLTGIRPFEPGKTAADFLVDFAQGRGYFPNILTSHALKEKLQVLPMLEDILDSRSFVLNDLSSVEKLHRLDFSEAIKAKDEDFLLLFKDSDKGTVPASLMKLKGELAANIKGINEKVILGIYRERDGRIEQLSLNDDYIKDGGKQLLSLLQLRELDTFQNQIPDTELGELEEKGSLFSVRTLDSDADGISDEDELKQGTNPYDFRSQPGLTSLEENSLASEEVALVSSSLAVADFIKNKDVAGLNRHLKEGIKDYLDSEKYKDYLTKMSQLNNYSSRNLRLILAQNPQATQVASFKQWKETFDRHVKKGEKSIRIFAPMTKIKKDEYNQPILDKYGNPETVTFFGLVPVFDVSQTDGKELPKAVSDIKDQLTDLDYANLYRTLIAIAKENGVSVRFEEMAGDTKGYYNASEHQIVLRSNDMNKSQLIKTFIHETAHSELHHANNPQKDQLTRSTAELQAESIAYVVASYYGIDTSDYSFAYLAGWSDDKETLADLEAQLDIVQQEAKSLMVRMDQQLEQLRLTQEKQNQHQFEQKLQKFTDQSKQAIEAHKQEQKSEAHSKKEKGFSK